MKRTPLLYIKKVRGMGRGVFAGQRIRCGQIIEVCPMLLFPFNDFDALGTATGSGLYGTTFENYIFGMGNHAALALGYGSLYNHSRNPNAFHSKDKAKSEITIHANRQIKKDEQIFIDYGWETLPFIDAS